MRSTKLAVVLALASAAVAAAPQVAVADPPAHNYPVHSAGCLAATSPLPLGQSVAQTITSGGVTRDYLVHLPTTYLPGHEKPLVLAFHGRKGDGTDIERYSKIDSLDTIAVYPVGAKGEDDERAWQGAPYAAAVDDVQFVADLLDKLQTTLCVDPVRIYAVGKSNGGGFAALLACRLPLRIAAFGAVAGAFYPGTATGCSSVATPIIEFHGTADSVIDYAGDSDNHGQPVPSIATWVQGWATHDSCPATPTTTQLNTEVVRITWAPCVQNTAVAHYKILTGDHTWPGAVVYSGPGKTTSQIEAHLVIWDFFTAHTLNAFIIS
ncbi:PHB depolymerase family esterase [Actinokineospora sp. NBRC 105648]|uniref:alpha/beta hydrolase family esterase n=1 Tax=Actinokineospora sp. NBRC 105648 TaxID=3032206 RepID=UPI0024A23C60|nr:PHB depolymerase family esterase [Actinokineospora sp. NBRC 105648]GLZ39721.1 esterase [Actinokineospora sp. NBRC 105648]